MCLNAYCNGTNATIPVILGYANYPIDIDLTHPTHCITERTQCTRSSLLLDKADKDLRDFLEHYGKSSNTTTCPKLILVKTTQPILDPQGKPMSQR